MYYIAFKLFENKHFYRYKPLLFQSQYSLCTIACPLFIHSNQLIFLLEIKVCQKNFHVKNFGPESNFFGPGLIFFKNIGGPTRTNIFKNFAKNFGLSSFLCAFTC